MYEKHYAPRLSLLNLRRSFRFPLLFLPLLLFLFYEQQARLLSISHKQSIQYGSFMPPYPPPLSSVYTEPTRKSREALYYAQHDFSKPLALTSYIRPSSTQKAGLELYVFTTGVAMGASRRNFSVTGCMVGKDVYESDRFHEDVVRCQLPRAVAPGELISVVLKHDQVLQQAMNGSVTLSGGFVATLDTGDVVPLEDKVTLHGSMKGRDANNFRRIRSKVTHSGKTEAVVPQKASQAPRFRLCMMTQIKPFADMIPDWVDYHRRIGVDKVFIFDNGAEENLKAMYQGRGDVEVVYWPWQASQTQAFAYLLIASRARCEWVLFSDVDEYVMFGIGDGDKFKHDTAPFRKFLTVVERKHFPQYRFLYLIMGNSGYMRRPKKPVAEAYTHRKEPQTKENGKSICYTDYDWIGSQIHTCKSNHGLSTMWREETRQMFPQDENDIPSLVHYQFRGFEENVLKNQAGRQTMATVLKSKEEEEGRKKKLQLGQEIPKGWLGTDSGRVRYWDHFRVIWRRITRGLELADVMVVQEKTNESCRWEYGSTYISESCSEKSERVMRGDERYNHS